jgi:pimeloyl-ACP methyl ester carboxylesterase
MAARDGFFPATGMPDRACWAALWPDPGKVLRMHEQFELRTLDVNGITLRAAVEGDGPLVILVHGWPELWYSWRHQIKPIARAGYRVVVPDVRGYGGSDKPHAVEAYDMATLMDDLIGIIDAFGEASAILVGHDWGAPICWNTAALHPERVAAVDGAERALPQARQSVADRNGTAHLCRQILLPTLFSGRRGRRSRVGGRRANVVA